MTPLQRCHLDAFVVAMSVLRVPGTEVDGIDACGGELGDRSPGLLRPECEITRLEEPRDQGVADVDRSRRSVAVDVDADISHGHELAQPGFCVGRGMPRRV